MQRTVAACVQTFVSRLRTGNSLETTAAWREKKVQFSTSTDKEIPISSSAGHSCPYWAQQGVNIWVFPWLLCSDVLFKDALGLICCRKATFTAEIRRSLHKKWHTLRWCQFKECPASCNISKITTQTRTGNSLSLQPHPVSASSRRGSAPVCSPLTTWAWIHTPHQNHSSSLHFSVFESISMISLMV